jgi:hypothetical protein
MTMLQRFVFQSEVRERGDLGLADTFTDPLLPSDSLRAFVSSWSSAYACRFSVVVLDAGAAWAEPEALHVHQNLAVIAAQTDLVEVIATPMQILCVNG